MNGPRPLSRRRFGRSLAVAATGATAVSLAGCTSAGTDPGDGFDGPGRTLRRWLPASDVLDPESDRYERFQSGFIWSPGAIAAVNERVDDSIFQYLAEQVERRFEPLELGVEDVRTMLTVELDPDVAVAATSGAAAEYADTLEDEGFEEEGPVRGFRLFVTEERTDPSAAFALDGGMVLHARGEDAPDRLDTALATRAGATPRLVDESPAAVALFDHLGGRTLLQARHRTRPLPADEAGDGRGRFAGTVASGAGATIEGSTFHQRSVTVFDDPDDVDLDAIQDDVERRREDARFVGAPEDTTVTQDGRVVVVTTQIPLEELVRDAN
jgi:hypothetical protein